jgi:hypothetical protein
MQGLNAERARREAPLTDEFSVGNSFATRRDGSRLAWTPKPTRASSAVVVQREADGKWPTGMAEFVTDPDGRKCVAGKGFGDGTREGLLHELAQFEDTGAFSDVSFRLVFADQVTVAVAPSLREAVRTEYERMRQLPVEVD